MTKYDKIVAWVMLLLFILGCAIMVVAYNP